VLDQIAFTGAGWEHEYFSYRFDTLPHAGLPRAEDHGKPAESREPDAAVSINFSARIVVADPKVGA